MHWFFVRQLYCVLAVGIFGLLGGCATPKLAVTYTSDPSGAVLYYGQQNYGYTPRTIEYDIAPEDRKVGRATLAGMSVRWASGAYAEVDKLETDLSLGDRQTFNFVRPASYPGREKDAYFALELEKVRAAKSQADAARMSAALSAISTSSQNVQNLYQQQNRSMSCNSTRYGNTINTQCF